MSTIKLFRVNGWLDDKGFDKRIREYDVKEAAKSFVWEGNRVDKGRLMKIDTIWIEKHTLVNYYTYCLDGEQQKALDLLKDHMINKVKKYKAEIDVLMQYIPE